MPDYETIDDETAIADFLKRIRHYEERYEPLCPTFDAALSWMKIIDVGQRMELNRIQSYVPCRISFLMQHLRITPRKLWFTRHGESEYNRVKRLGGNAPLTADGRRYATALTAWINAQVQEEKEGGGGGGGGGGRHASEPADDGRPRLTVWTSTLRRTIETAEHFEEDPSVLVLNMPALDEIDAGSFDG